jgi:hypothetical protein
MVEPQAKHLRKRRKIAKTIAMIKRIGYSLLLLSIISFFLSSMLNYNRFLLLTSTFGLLIACVILPVPIVLGYGVKAAQREEL